MLLNVKTRFTQKINTNLVSTETNLLNFVELKIMSLYFIRN